jgi:hypothetical protein
MTQALWFPQAITSPQETLEFNINGLHRTTSPSSDYTTILIIIDHFTKQSIFIPTTDTITVRAT